MRKWIMQCKANQTIFLKGLAFRACWNPFLASYKTQISRLQPILAMFWWPFLKKIGKVKIWSIILYSFKKCQLKIVKFGSHLFFGVTQEARKWFHNALEDYLWELDSIHLNPYCALHWLNHFNGMISCAPSSIYDIFNARGTWQVFKVWEIWDTLEIWKVYHGLEQPGHSAAE